MEQSEESRRRIDRVAAPDLLEGLGELSLAQLRALRDECREEETGLSYARRVVQGQIDITSSELERRESGEESTSALVERLSAILADAPSSSPREARTMSFYTPDESHHRRRSDAAADLPSLAMLPDLDPEQIASLLTQLRAEEQRLSRLRRAVLDNLDGLQAELVRRYSESTTDVDAVLSSTLHPHDEQA